MFHGPPYEPVDRCNCWTITNPEGDAREVADDFDRRNGTGRIYAWVDGDSFMVTALSLESALQELMVHYPGHTLHPPTHDPKDEP